MKTRTVVMSLILSVGFITAACGIAGGPADEGRPEPGAPPAATDETARSGIVKELDQAASLVQKANDELDQGTDEAQGRAKRLLGYPVFLGEDLNDPLGLAKRLQSNRELSNYLFSNFAPANQKIVKEQADLSILTSALVQELNKQLENRELYQAARFPKDKLTAETSAELVRNQSRLNKLPLPELIYLNRLLLQDSYRDFIQAADRESAVRRLTEAERLTSALGPSDVQRKTQASIGDALAAARSILNRPADEGGEKLITAEDVDKISVNIVAALDNLKTRDESAPGITDWIKQILWDLVYYLLVAIAVIIPIGVIAFFIKRARDNAAARELANIQAFKKVFERHDHLQQEFNLFKNQNTAELRDLKDQISRLESAQSILARQNAHPGNPPPGNQIYDRFCEPPQAPLKEEPEFPVSAESYLQRMKGLNRPGTVIRPDFQNGILVKDAEGLGELVLIEDPAGPADLQRLLVVPSVSQFHMSQDFYNYYHGFYECDQPSAGDVWIVHPAIVEKVTGGWRLMEKGRLEVR